MADENKNRNVSDIKRSLDTARNAYWYYGPDGPQPDPELRRRAADDYDRYMDDKEHYL